MDFALKDFGATLIVGAYFLFGIEILLYLFFGTNISLHLNIRNRFSETGVIGIVVAISFGVGMLVEDLSNKFVDEDTFFQKFHMLPSERELRAQSLFGEQPEIKVKSLAYETASLQLLSRYGGDQGVEIERLIIKDKTIRGLSTKDIQDAASRLYYHAKNTVYKDENYYDELKRIQSRIDFARSTAIVSVYLALTALLLGIIKLIFAGNDPLPGRWLPNSLDKFLKMHQRLDIAARIVGVLILLGIIYLGGRYSYAAEEREFDVRSFGYFRSLSLDKSGS